MSFLKFVSHAVGIGYDKDGYNRFGYDRYGCDRDGFDRDGFKGAIDTHKWNRDGINKYTGTIFDKWGKDKKGYDKDGYCGNGWDKEGIHKITGTKYRPDGLDRDWYYSDGWSHSGHNHKLTGTEYDPDGYTKDGYNLAFPKYISGSDHKEYVKNYHYVHDNAYSRDGWNIEGWNKDGINKYTGTKFDKNGHPKVYDLYGFNKGGWDRGGIHKSTGCEFDDNGYRKDGSCNPAVVVKQEKGQEDYDLAIKCLHFHNPGSGELSKLAKSAAKKGHTQAQYLLGLLYECGKYLPKDHPIPDSFGPEPRSIPKYYEPSPDSLFLMYNGVPPNFQKAIKWYLSAARQGHETAKRRLENLDDSIDIASLVEGKDQNKYNYVEIQGAVESKKIDYVVHFTRLKNLDSILSHGLKTRQNIQELNISSEFNDEYRFDQQENSVSCSIQFPNYKMLYRLQQDNPDTEWIVILLDSSLLWKKDCAFSTTNAASNSVTSIPLKYRKGEKAFNMLFNEIPEKPYRSQLGIPDKYPTDPQAEVLVLDNINLEYINAIITNNKKREIQLNKKYPEIEFLYSESMFTPRKDYDHWR